MNEPALGSLWEQTTVHRRLREGSLPPWAVDHYESYREGLLGERDGQPFPCYFGIEVEQAGDTLYTFVPSMTEASDLLDFAETLLEYLQVYDDYADRAPLTAFFAPPDDEDLTEADYHERLWNLLQFLHVHDPEPWPTDIPTTPDDERWEFCFGGTPMFPTCRAPFYETRRSRYCPVGLEITFQPRSIFDGLTADTQAGQGARDVIQGRIAAYDGEPPHHHLGDWGVEGDREWRQYLFSDDPEEAPSECPMYVTREHPKSRRLVGTVGG
jgi:FPC/CPF motif-containing protein YcgG